MRVFIAGIDGYLGWPLAQHLAARGHETAGADALLRRAWVAEMGSDSAVPVATIGERLAAYREHFGASLPFTEVNLRDHDALGRALAAFAPDAVVHLAECPSAPYSMMDHRHAEFVQSNNVSGTLSLLFAMRDHCPEAHLVKLGSMGEYGTPDVDIPEGFFEVEFRGRRDRLPFPRQAGSWYHWSKVFDSENVAFACRMWGLRATDVMQGVVYGTWCPGDLRLNSRLDFDEAFGTAVHRFCCQAVIGHPITPYGSGAQRRGVLSLADALQCLTLALENPPGPGEYRVFNQLRDVRSLAELAELVQAAACSLGIGARVVPVANPRAETEGHHYRPDSNELPKLGFRPSAPMDEELRRLISDLLPHAGRIAAHADRLPPTVRWRARTARAHTMPKTPDRGREPS
ncbi:NAD-dependent epimerase/dehydratase family protein [Streptomyces cinnamoneus]|uniref:NAD-dependent epimerase/dehydratase family protein n=1 Tax=Streptomyces cinnamoneus TaxID=53446 RepID=UPI003796DE1E